MNLKTGGKKDWLGVGLRSFFEKNLKKSKFWADSANLFDRLTKLHQHPARRFRVKKKHQFIVRAQFWFARKRHKPLILKPLHFQKDILNLKGDMVDSLAFFFQKTGNGRVRARRFEQFYFRLARREKGGRYLFRGHFFYFIKRRSEQFFPKFIGGCEVADGDADMVDFHFSFK